MRPVALLAALTLVAAPVYSGDRPDTEVPDSAGVQVERFLVLGPATWPLPLFHDESRGAVSVTDLVRATPLEMDDVRPSATVEWLGGQRLAWVERGVGKDALVPLEAGGGAPQVAWLATRVRAERFAKLEVEVTGSHPRRLLVGREQVAAGAATRRTGSRRR